MCVTKRPFLEQKNPNQKFQLSFAFAFFLLFQQQKPHKLVETPIFVVFLQTWKKDNFQNLNVKQRKLKNPVFEPFFWKKRLVLENWQTIGHEKHKMIAEQKQNRLKPPFFVAKMTLAQLVPLNLAQLVTFKNPKLGPVNNSTAYIYIYMHAVKLLTGPSLAFSKVINWSKFALF